MSAEIIANFVITIARRLNVISALVIGNQLVHHTKQKNGTIHSFRVILASAQQKPMCHFNLGKLTDFQERHITNRKYRDSGIHGQFDRSILLWKMTVGVSGVCSLTSEVHASLNKGVPPPAYFDWRGWFRVGLPFFREDMT
ncbi:hypothetical protein J6590_001239 [Homalodisca vitripennis]|nr:hypothetical protein J6590_001239 [Homalodisca vitripennis]